MKFSFEQRQEFLNNCRYLYIELVSKVKEYFEFDDSIFDLVQIVRPEVAQTSKEKSLSSVFKRFPVLSKVVNQQTAENEWRAYKLQKHEERGIGPGDPAHLHWSKVSKLRNSTGKPIFKNLCKVMRLLLILPYSNASVERIFSQLKLIKNDHRSCISTDNVVATLATKRGVKAAGGSSKFKPTKEMLATKPRSASQKKPKNPKETELREAGERMRNSAHYEGEDVHRWDI